MPLSEEVSLVLSDALRTAEVRLGAALAPSVEGASQMADGLETGPAADIHETSALSPEAILQCPQCASTLYKPVTMGDGVSVCEGCVSKRPDTAEAPAEVGYGGALDVVLSELTTLCHGSLLDGARLRHEGNAAFREGKYSEACELYSTAIRLCASDVALRCNRAAARLKTGDVTGALDDSEAACELCRIPMSSRAPGRAWVGPGSSLWAKALYRRGQARFRGDEHADAIVDLVYSAVPAPGTAAVGTPVKPPPELAHALAAVMKGSGGPNVEGLAKWLDQHLEAGLARLMEARSDFEEAVPSAVTQNQLPASSISAIREKTECALCVNLFHDPATTPCGHTFCRGCLARVLDNAFDIVPTCPLCRMSLAPYLSWLNYQARAAANLKGKMFSHGGSQISLNKCVHRMLLHNLGDEYGARCRRAKEDEAEAGSGSDECTVPVFVCTMGLPGVKCPLHIFEPRYRLMMRRCLDSGQRMFGMAVSNNAQYGTMLTITRFEQLDDGRSALETVGSRRFKVLSWDSKDGYSTARVEWLHDQSTEQEAEQEETARLEDELRTLISSLLRQLPRARLQYVTEQLGELPSSPVELVFWATAVLGLPAGLQYSIAYGEGCRHSHLRRLRKLMGLLRQGTAEDSGWDDGDGGQDDDDGDDQSAEESSEAGSDDDNNDDSATGENV